ncbi:MAG: hypothetical protein CME65_07855 [Halobacteriovoraceae bacterium]|nr:hypothetical protein [Halobacteriovoraceae bacterium]
MNKAKSFLSYYRQLLKPEGPYFIISIIYGVAVSLITLAIPISVQALVNTIAFGVLIQPLVILTILLLALLIISSFLKGLQTYIIEIFQRHFFIRVSTDVAHNLMLSSKYDVTETYGVELVNRFFDIMTVQKKSTTLITGGIALALQTVLGLILLAFYHPYFLIFDLILIVILTGIWWGFGRLAMATAVEESNKKYKLAAWLEEVARSNLLFKREKFRRAIYKKTDDSVFSYIQTRKRHFRLLFSQIVLLLIGYAILSALILGLGGFLVITGELSLGQLVAAELIVTAILAGIGSAGKYLEDFYDLYAALNKISYLYKFKPDENLGKPHVSFEDFNLKVKFNDTPVTFEKGKSYQILCPYYNWKSDLIDTLRGFDEKGRSKIQLGNISYEDLCTFQLNDHIAVIQEPQVFGGTILENLTLGLDKISMDKVDAALELLDLKKVVYSLEDGIDTVLNPNGFPLWDAQLLKLTIAREIIQGTEIIVMVDLFENFDRKLHHKMLDYLVDGDRTLIVLSSVVDEETRFNGHILADADGIHICSDASELKKMWVKYE